MDQGWKKDVQGHNMFQVVKILKSLEQPLRNLLKSQGNLHDRVVRLRHELDEVQKALDKDPACVSLREEEGVYLRAFNEATLDEERFLKQKAKLEWLRVGDSNSAYFHKTVKERVSRNRIDIITDMNNVTHTNNEVPTAFVEHYMNFLGSSAPVSNLDNRGLFSKKISNEKADYMVREVTNGEIKDAMFSIDNDKAPGPDGFTLLFFKKSWDLVGNDVCQSLIP
ncbi:hypothetical protein Tco_0579436 [Tanacetum coccineum]